MWRLKGVALLVVLSFLFLPAAGFGPTAWATELRVDEESVEREMEVLNYNLAMIAYNIGLTHQRRGDLDKAVIEYTEAVRRKPDFAKAYHNRGVAYYDLGELDQSLSDLNKALELDPTMPKAYFSRGMLWELKDEPSKALEDYRMALGLAPDEEKYRSAVKDLEQKLK